MKAKRGMLRASGVLVGAVLAVGVLVPTSASAAPAVERLGGADRYAVSVAVSRAAVPTPAAGGTVVLVSGRTFADALSAGPVAAALGGVMLLVTDSEVPASVSAEIQRLRPAHAIVIGGPGTIKESVITTIRSLVPDTTRVWGSNRYTGSLEAIRTGFPGGADHVYIATGVTFPDALSGGALAGATNAPLLILRGLDATPTPEVLQLLDDLGTTSITLLGGTGSITPGIEAALRATSRTVDRIGGADRYAVAAGVAQRFPGAGSSVLVASGLNFPDALSASSLAVRRSAPVLLSRPLCADATVRSYVSAHGVTRITLIGGPASLRGLVGTLAACPNTTSAKSISVLVNKKHPINPKSYAPAGLRRVNLSGGYSMRSEAATALEKMSAASKAAGHGKLGVASGYRSYSTQVAVYNNFVNSRGRASADLVSARPGHSEHQLGLTADVVACAPGCGSIDGFGGSATGKWVKANAYRYGFIVRYEPGMTSITGYSSEPWHLRYIGTTLAGDYHAGGFHTLEQYFGYPAAPKY